MGNAVPGQRRSRFRAKYADGRTNMKFRKFLVQPINHGKNALEFRIHGPVAVTAGNKPEMRHPLFGASPGLKKDRILVNKRIDLYIGMVVARLGAKPAVLTAYPGFGVHDRTGMNATLCPAGSDLVGKRSKVKRKLPRQSGKKQGLFTGNGFASFKNPVCRCNSGMKRFCVHALH